MRGAGELSKDSNSSKPHAQPALCYRLSVGPHLPQIVVITAGPRASVSDSGTPEVWRMSGVYINVLQLEAIPVASHDINLPRKMSAVVHMCSYAASSGIARDHDHSPAKQSKAGDSNFLGILRHVPVADRTNTSTLTSTSLRSPRSCFKSRAVRHNLDHHVYSLTIHGTS